MKIVADDRHSAHWGKELANGVFGPSWEQPIRADYVDAELSDRGFGPPIAPTPVPDELLGNVHSERYVRFIDRAWERWCEAGREESGAALAYCWPTAPGSDTLSGRYAAPDALDIDNDPIDLLLGLFSFAADCSITAHTAGAARAAASAAFTAANILSATPDHPVFARCRPPGHHAMRESFGGYCYFSNAAIAAQRLRDLGAERVAVLDVDYHHGNGTQQIFYDRADVTFASIHADPRTDFPFYLGYADEIGQGPGLGANMNLPLPSGTVFSTWSAALDRALSTVAGADAIVISLGVDTFENDPISTFRLTSDNFLTMGAQLATAGLPTMFVMEGGYATEAIGVNMVNVLDGFMNG